jgi:hypothetical protein
LTEFGENPDVVPTVGQFWQTPIYSRLWPTSSSNSNFGGFFNCPLRAGKKLDDFWVVKNVSGVVSLFLRRLFYHLLRPVKHTHSNIGQISLAVINEAKRLPSSYTLVYIIIGPRIWIGIQVAQLHMERNRWEPIE